jgi:hypothetical protein
LHRFVDRPPVLRFLVLFAGLLAVALGLAAVSDAAQPALDREPAAGLGAGQSASAAPAEGAAPGKSVSTP